MVHLSERRVCLNSVTISKTTSIWVRVVAVNSQGNLMTQSVIWKDVTAPWFGVELVCEIDFVSLTFASYLSKCYLCKIAYKLSS